MAETIYERVCWRNERGKRRITILRNPTESVVAGVPVLSGVAVNLDGSNVGSLVVNEQCHIIGFDLVDRRTPLVMSRHYGRLVEPPTVSIEFWPWADIPADRKREVTCDGDNIDMEVLGETFLGEPTWLPWMGAR